MTDALNCYAMPREELSRYLAEQRESGFTELDSKKRAFGLAFIQTGSYVESANEAGIQPGTGRRWLKDPLVAAFINYLNKQQEQYSLIDASFVESQYLGLLAKVSGEEDVPFVDKDGMQKTGKIFNGPAAVSCLRDLAKISGHYKEDQTTVNVTVAAQLTDEQRRILDEKLDNAF